MAQSRLEILISAIDQASPQLTKLGGNLMKVGSTATRVGGLMTMAGAGIVAAYTGATMAAMKQEEVENRLKVIYGDGADSLIEYAAAMQKKTRYGDEEIINAMAIGSTYRNLKGDMEVATETALDMAEAYGMDVTQAMHLLGKASAGQVGMLSRYGIIVDKAKVKTEGMSAVYEAIAAETKHAATETDNASKSFAQMKNAMGDLAEKVGNALLPLVKALTPHIIKLADKLGQMSESPFGRFLIKSHLALGVFLVVAGGGLVILGQLATAISSIISLLPILAGGAGLGGAATAATGATAAIGTTTGAVGGLGAMLLAVAPYAIAIAAIAALVYELWLLKQAYDVSAEAGKEAKASIADVAAMEDKGVTEDYTDVDIRNRQRREVKAARATFGERVSGAITGGGMTSRDYAQARVQAEQASGVFLTRQRERATQENSSRDQREVVRRDSFGGQQNYAQARVQASQSKGVGGGSQRIVMEHRGLPDGVLSKREVREIVYSATADTLAAAH